MSSEDSHTEVNPSTLQVVGEVDIVRLQQLLQQDTDLMLQVVAAHPNRKLSPCHADSEED